MNLDYLFGFVLFFILGTVGLKKPRYKFNLIYGWIFEEISLKKTGIHRIRILSGAELFASSILLLFSITSF